MSLTLPKNFWRLDSPPATISASQDHKRPRPLEIHETHRKHTRPTHTPALLQYQQMHLKSNEKSLQSLTSKTMASYHGEDGGGGGGGGGDGEGGGSGDGGGRTSRTSSNNNSSSNKNNNNNNTEESNQSANPPADASTPDQIKLKREALEQRKQELERMLSEKSWLLQQLQKQETQIINGNFEYLNLNEIFSNLAQQYKTEQGGGSGGSGTSILRRKTATGSSNSKDHQNINNNNNNSNSNNNNRRQSDALSNRSSEYDNYPGGGGGGKGCGGGSGSIEGTVGVGVAVASQQMPPSQSLQNASLKKRVGTPIATGTAAAANYNYMQLQRQQLLQQHVEQQMLQQHAAEQALLQQHAVEQQMLQQHLQYAAEQQRKQHKMLLQHAAAAHYHQQHLASPPPQHHLGSPQHARHLPPHAADAISLYSVNSASVATLRQQHVSPQQQPQPIVVQCDKYYLSPTSHATSYSDGGGFIKSSQNIKKYISPLASPTLSPSQHPQQQQHLLLQQHTRALDAISLAPSYAVSMDAECVSAAATHNLRWRSQSHIAAPPPPQLSADAATNKSHSSDMLEQLPHAAVATAFYYNPPPPPPSHLKPTPPKPLDEISISSHNSAGEISIVSQKSTSASLKSRPKQWLESSLDGPVIRAPLAEPPLPLKPHPKNKLSSHSMSAHSNASPSSRHYSMSAGVKPLTGSGVSKLLLQDAADVGRYAKLSQSTSYLNSLAAESGAGGVSISPAYHLDADLASFKYLPPKLVAATTTPTRLTPPPRPPPAGEKSREAARENAAAAPEIRIESPKNMTVVQQATFQPYKEVTKPFEMSDFYKYSTKFRQKEATGGNPAD